MLFRRAFLEGLRAGRLHLAFRRWARPVVKPGSTIRTAIGVVRVDAIAAVDLASVPARDARRAGFESRAALSAEMDRRPGTLYRITVAYDGPDARVALRARRRLSAREWQAIQTDLGRIDSASRRGPWTLETLTLLERHPGVRAADLAPRLARDTLAFKRDIRLLKELGLTESLEVGYRLSPRGRAALALFRNPR